MNRFLAALALLALAAVPAAAQQAPSSGLDQAYAKAQADIQAAVAALNAQLQQLNLDMTALQAQIGSADKVLNTVSPDGTMVPGTATQIVDSTGAVWLLGPTAGPGGDIIIRNGAPQSGTQANLLYYHQGVVWQRNAQGIWWHWVDKPGLWQPNGGTTQSPIPAPPPPSNPPPSNPPPPNNPPPPPPSTTPPSANDSTIAPTGQLVDATGNVWTLANATPQENGKASPLPQNSTAVALLYHGGAIYAEDYQSCWYVFKAGAWSQVAGDPRA